MKANPDRPVIEFEDIVVFKGRPREVGDDVVKDGRAVLFVPETTYLVIQHGHTLSARYPGVHTLLERGRFALIDEASLAHAKAEGIEAHANLTNDPELYVARLDNKFIDSGPITARPKPGDVARSGKVDGWVREVTRDNLERLTYALSSFRTRHAQSPEFDRATNLVRGWLESVGYKVEKRRVVSDKLPFTYNLVASRPCRLESSPYVIVCAHLDSMTESFRRDLTAPAPGALDNASGCAALISIAIVLRDLALGNPAVDVEFVLFGGEENKLQGSEFHASQLPCKDAMVRSVLNLDMPTPLRSNGKWKIMFDPQPDDSTWIANQLSACAAVYGLHKLELRYLSSGYISSDHVPLSKRGIPSVLVAENCRANPRAHTTDDVASRIDYDALEAVTKMCCAWVAHVLLGDLEPPEAEETP